MSTKKQYLELKKELTELEEFTLVSKLIDLYFDTKIEEFNKGVEAVNETYKKFNQ